MRFDLLLSVSLDFHRADIVLMNKNKNSQLKYEKDLLRMYRERARSQVLLNIKEFIKKKTYRFFISFIGG